MLFDSSKASNRILIIDDNVDIHEDFQTILAKRVTVNSNRFNLDALEDDIFGNEVKEKDSNSGSVVEYDLDFASQGQDGLNKVIEAKNQERPFFLAFVDMRMPPGWDGLKTIEKLWAVDPDLQVVICTAFSDYSQLEITERLGLNDNLLILKKPFDQEEVSQLACTLYQKREMTRIAVLAMTKMEQLVAERTEDMARSQMKMGQIQRKMDILVKRLKAENNTDLLAEATKLCAEITTT